MLLLGFDAWTKKEKEVDAWGSGAMELRKFVSPPRDGSLEITLNGVSGDSSGTMRVSERWILLSGARHHLAGDVFFAPE